MADLRPMMLPVERLLRSDPAEDRALLEMAWPRFLDRGVPLLGLALTTSVLTAALLAGDGAHPLALGLVALSAAPWLFWLVSSNRITDREPPSTWYENLFRVEAVLVPVAVLYLAGWLAGVDLGSSVAYQLILFPVLMTVTLQILCRTRPVAWAIAVVGLGIHILGTTQWANRVQQFDWTGVIAQTVGFVFTICAAVAVRQGSVAVHQAGQALARQAMSEERRRVAREVHDVIAHTLAITMLHVTGARMAVDKGKLATAAEALRDAERQGRASLVDVRRIVRLLRADDWAAVESPQPQLADIDELVDSYRAAGLEIEQTIAGDLRLVPPSAALVLYQVLQEALANAARHGSGPPVVDLRAHGDVVTLDVVNDVETQAAADVPGSGLVGMRERAGAAGGTVVAGREGDRWVVRARLPIGPDEEVAFDATELQITVEPAQAAGELLSKPPAEPNTEIRA